jgi:hypothetical protein
MGGPGPVGQRNRQKNGSDAFGLVDQTRREGIGRGFVTNRESIARKGTAM